jgi:diguanylate cyclase (GGDEF)-like protein
MNILAITKHAALVERLRTAFEGAGNPVQHVQDPLDALASEAWGQAQLILVDAGGDPMDGFRFCALLRGESRILFQNLPIFLIFELPPEEAELARIRATDADGFILADDSIQRLLTVLGPGVEADGGRGSGPRVPLLTAGLHPETSKRIQGLVNHFGFELMTSPIEALPEVQRRIKAPLLLLGLDSTGARTLKALQAMRQHECSPYVILLGKTSRHALQRKLLLAGAMDWLSLPLSPPRLLHACRRGLEWIHAKRIQREFQFQIGDLRERRLQLEMETAALRNEVLTDPLTGLLNRRAFDQNLENAFNQWDRHRRAFVLVLGDLDYFKLINDRFGHLVGDEVLRALAGRMRGGLRKSDLAFRIGGEEFAILLMETTLQAGAEVAEKLRGRIDANPIVLESGQRVFPTMSFGVGGPEGFAPEALFGAVDQALYAAKNKGRNRVEVAQPKSGQATGITGPG